MTLSPEVVESYKKILLNPSEYAFRFAPITECFKDSADVISNHELFESYSNYVKVNVPKIIFYIIMDELFISRIGKDIRGNLGYHLTFTEPKPTAD